MATYDPVTIVYLCIVLGGMPVLGVRSYLRLKSGKPMPAKSRLYRGMIGTQIVLLGYSVLVARHNQVDSLGTPPAMWVWLIAAVYVALIAKRLRAAWKTMSAQRKQRARRLLPESWHDMRYWVVISLLAGISEEFAFRGTAFVALRDLSGSMALAVTVCVIAFALAHILQGWRGVLGTGVIALAMHLIVYMTHGLYLAIAVHVCYDLIVGIIALRQFRLDGNAVAVQMTSVSSGG